MDTLAKETMGLPIFICPTNHQIISSGTSSNSSRSSASTTNAANTTSTTSTNTSPTTSFFATATPTRSPTTPTFLPLTTIPNSAAAQTHQRRNTYTPPTFSPSNRRESLLSTHRLSQAFDFASTLAAEVLSKAADSVFGEAGQSVGQGMEQGIWGEDLEAGEAQRERERKEKARFARFGDEGGFDGWLD